jgi:pSer/pThr/pTyr-binding forkhead associated (FHA) protein
MRARVLLTIVEGSLQGKKFVLEKRGRYVVGRAEDCDLQLLEGEGLAGISRHHCVLAFDPPQLRIRDLGSRNGTFVNHTLIGRRSAEEPSSLAGGDDFTDFELEDGDELRIGSFVFCVTILDPKALRELHSKYVYGRV